MPDRVRVPLAPSARGSIASAVRPAQTLGRPPASETTQRAAHQLLRLARPAARPGSAAAVPRRSARCGPSASPSRSDGLALDDLPRQAKRLARWQARRLDATTGAATSDRAAREHAALTRRQQACGGEQARKGKTLLQRLSPMRPGRPPGWRRRPTHAVDEVLNELHGLAIWARERPDTS